MTKLGRNDAQLKCSVEISGSLISSVSGRYLGNIYLNDTKCLHYGKKTHANMIDLQGKEVWEIAQRKYMG